MGMRMRMLRLRLHCRNTRNACQKPYNTQVEPPHTNPVLVQLQHTCHLSAEEENPLGLSPHKSRPTNLCFFAKFFPFHCLEPRTKHTKNTTTTTTTTPQTTHSTGCDKSNSVVGEFGSDIPRQLQKRSDIVVAILWQFDWLYASVPCIEVE